MTTDTPDGWTKIDLQNLDDTPIDRCSMAWTRDGITVGLRQNRDGSHDAVVYNGDELVNVLMRNSGGSAKAKCYDYMRGDA